MDRDSPCCTRPVRSLAASRTPQEVDSIDRQSLWRLLRQAGLRTREGKPDAIRIPMRHLPRPFAHAVLDDVTLRPSGWLFPGGRTAAHLHSPTVAGAVGELRLAPRTPFPFHPSATLSGHLLLRLVRTHPMTGHARTGVAVVRLANDKKVTAGCSGEECRRFTRRCGGPEYVQCENHSGRPASPHPGAHQTTILGRSSDSPSSFPGNLPVRTQWHCPESSGLQQRGLCRNVRSNRTEPPASRFTMPRGRGTWHPKRDAF